MGIILLCIIAVIIIKVVEAFAIQLTFESNIANMRKQEEAERARKAEDERQYKELEVKIFHKLGIDSWLYIEPDDRIDCKSGKAVTNYTLINYLKNNKDRLDFIQTRLKEKRNYKERLLRVFQYDEYKSSSLRNKLCEEINNNLKHLEAFEIMAVFDYSDGSSRKKIIPCTQENVDEIIKDPSLIMGKREYNQMIKTQTKELLEKKHHEYYSLVNDVIDLANNSKDNFVIKGDQEELDKLIASLFDRTVNSIKKIKTIDSEEWDVIGEFISKLKQDITKIIDRNQQIVDYYNSNDFAKIKSTCNSLMDSQREFNEYINEKAQSISKLFGSRIFRNETVVEDSYEYIRPYKKTITPFTAEVSAQVFASAENSPLDYIVKLFYPNKTQYPEQIQKLQLLIEELETLKEAKDIIDNYKKDYQKYIVDVPSYVMENDEDGFYSRLGFANISESVLTVEYKFSYTSNGGMARRNFTVPMTEEIIIELINNLQSKLTISPFAKEQRALMTSKLRQHIKERDNYTCRFCGNSTHKEPNLLLEIDHIIPVAKGGHTEENNLQTLCWRCNRSKSDKLIS